MNVNQVSVVPNDDSVEVIENRSLLYGGGSGFGGRFNRFGGAFLIGLALILGRLGAQEICKKLPMAAFFRFAHVFVRFP